LVFGIVVGSPAARADGIASSSIGYGLSCWTANGAGPDDDADGVNDLCEQNLAYWFGPWYYHDDGEDALGWRPHYSVRTLDYATKSVRIFYMHTYYRDAGDFLGISAHDGDPEFVNLDVHFNTADGRWYLDWMYTSAHRNQWCDESRWHSYSVVEYASTPRAWPIVHVAENKHANYRTDSECDDGCAWLDDCDYAFGRYLTDVTAASTTCGHSLCTTGAKLSSSCNSCTATVCGNDPYCCNTYWDGLCTAAAYYCTACRNAGSTSHQLVNYIQVNVGKGLNQEWLWRHTSSDTKFCGWQRSPGEGRDTCSNGYWEHVTDFGM